MKRPKKMTREQSKEGKIRKRYGKYKIFAVAQQEALDLYSAGLEYDNSLAYVSHY